ncbi:GNAT family N-acetyltransferase [Thermococcus sp. M39]|uniref:GNAT family N-acetyltransferase n=1 Tax=unclassified Thermococcus TaxID=2627626 RepID=UPI00143AACE5|nr:MULTISPECIES: GNAT family N-acetyltransferase [unclassified Thermococcus]NJE08684.1 GNAT family N-acetyltransferase [Thermococcus sp. M39]NJE13014.1 GNAT family N-acetyltransferase [Thermococcus sp. LS2]
MIRRAETEDIEDIVNFMIKCFRTYREWGLNREKFLTWLKCDDGVKLENIFLYEENGKIASMIQIVEREVKIGEDFLKCAGIANVCTAPEFRGRGIAKNLMSAVIQEIDKNYEISALFAGYGEIAHSIYQKYGFKDSYFTEYGIAVEQQLKEIEKSSYVREAAIGDAKDILRLYESRISNLGGVIKRDAEYIAEKFIKRTFWHTFFYSKEKGNALVFDDGKIRGYTFIMKGTLPGFCIVREVVGEDLEITWALLKAATEKMKAKSLVIYAPREELESLNVEIFRKPESYMFRNFEVENAYIFYSDRW